MVKGSASNQTSPAKKKGPLTRKLRRLRKGAQKAQELWPVIPERLRVPSSPPSLPQKWTSSPVAELNLRSKPLSGFNRLRRNPATNISIPPTHRTSMHSTGEWNALVSSFAQAVHLMGYRSDDPLTTAARAHRG